MKKENIIISYNRFDWLDLPHDYKTLINKSQEAQSKAYAPYSEFKVGASILLEDGTIFSGSNQENAAYPSGLCAERVAIFSCGAQFPDLKIKVMAITCDLDRLSLPDILAPCGACRQSICEYESRQNQPIKILLRCPGNMVLEFHSIEDLLPFSFKSNALKKLL
jgi:cytidine deaminase